MLYKINRDFYRVMSRNGKYIKRSRNVRLVGFSAAALLAIYLLLAVFPICYKDKDAEATVVPSTTTLSIVSSKDTASVEITPTSGAGTFATSAAADKAEFTVTTDNLTGYSLNLVGSDTSGQLVNSTTGDTLDTLTADVAETTFRTGAAETYANKWGYQLNVNSTTTTNFLAAPTTGTKTIYTTTGPNTSADSYTLGIGARVDYAKPEGTYTNTFVLTAVGNPISYQINYLDNTGEGGTTGEDVSDLPTAEGSANITASSFTLATGTPSRTGYNFVGWCYGTVDHTTDPSTCDGTTYQPGDTFTFTSIPSTGTATANLYAMWESAGSSLYNAVAAMSKGTQTAADLHTTITIPTSANRKQDTSNSGVYEYNSSVFGTSTDASNDYKIYYYRGVLENTPGSYGSDGSAVTYPNYVKLGNTCWRIVRTTGSGGVKMIYNGNWSGSTCAKSTTNTQLSSTNVFNGTSSTYHQLVRVGYTYKSSYASNSTTNRQAGVLFGTNSNFSGNTTNSDIKTAVENWYNANLSTYTSRLEGNAGYCGDRSINEWNSTLNSYSLLPESTTLAQYSTSSTTISFGAYIRNDSYGYGPAPSLSCGSYTLAGVTVDRSVVDVYSTNVAFGGNGQLSAPVALLTNDEASFAGSGGGASLYHSNSFLRSGSRFWLISPSRRLSDGSVYVTTIDEYGTHGENAPFGSEGVRPVISLSQGANISSGSGIATDPWEVEWEPYQAMQDFTADDADTMATGETKILRDARDNQEYTVAKLADGNVWMMTNLNLGATESLVVDQLDSTNTNFTGANASNTIPASTFLGSTWKKTRGSSSYTNPEYIPITASNSTTGSNTDPTSNTKYGTLYNYCAASAQTYCYDQNSGVGDASSDLCPAGWRLPTGGSSGEFQTLYNQSAYNSLANMRKPYTDGGVAFALAGNFSSTTPGAQNSNGTYWSSTQSSASAMRDLYLTDNSLNPVDNFSRHYGMSVRCILKPQTMQSFTTDDADTMAAGETRTLRDSRDGKEYTVAKLADGNVWMTENLNLAGGTALSADDTDVTSEYISGFSTQGNLTKNANNTISLPASSTSGFNNNSNAYVYNTSSTTCGNGNPCYGYYSWIAATLGGKQADGSTAETRDGYNAAASICPKGWKLPSSTTSNAPATTSPNWKTGDYYRLATAYGANLESSYNESAATFYNNAGPGKVPNFLLAGRYNSGSFNDGGSTGYYWSSSSYSSTNAYNLYFNSSVVYSASSHSRYYGFAVRCLLSDERTLDDITYLQDMNSGIASRTATGTMKTLIDKRDNQQYTVQKLADGKVWMMDNLNLGATNSLNVDQLDNTNTNINNSSTIAASTFLSSTWKKSSGSGTYTAPEYIPITASNSTTGSDTDPTSNTKYGTLYNYCAASAQTICTDSNSVDASSDLCPSGWRLPTGNTSGEFQTLYNQSAYHGNAEMRKPYAATNGGAAFALAGYFNTSTPTHQGSYGRYWSSTRSTNTYMYYLNLDTSNVSPANYTYRYSGHSIRCVLK